MYGSLEQHASATYQAPVIIMAAMVRDEMQAIIIA
jgi:hypothetical protein